MVFLTERSGEVGHGSKAGLYTDLLQWYIGADYQISGIIQSDLLNIPAQRDPGQFLKTFAQILGGQIGNVGEKVQI